MFVHDSLMFEVKKDKANLYAERIKYHMEHPPLERFFGIHLRVPLKADIKIGPNRGDMVSF